MGAVSGEDEVVASWEQVLPFLRLSFLDARLAESLKVKVVDGVCVVGICCFCVCCFWAHGSRKPLKVIDRVCSKEQ